MSEIFFVSPNQTSLSYEGEPHKYPKYGKSTTDPTYYEPAATRIANMKKSAGMKLEGIYDYYSKDDVSKFNEANFDKNIRNATYDPRFNNNLTREEISQVVSNLSDKADTMIDKKKTAAKDKSDRINEQLEISNKIQENIETKSTE